LVMRTDGRGGLFRAGSDACRAVRLAAGRRPDRLAESGADLECQVQTAPAALDSPLPRSRVRTNRSASLAHTTACCRSGSTTRRDTAGRTGADDVAVTVSS